MDTLSMPLFWGSSKMVTRFSLPRRYTSTHDDNKREIYLTIDTKYNSKQLDTEEVKNVESQILGKWVNSKTIKLVAIVSSEKNPQAAIRDKIIRLELPNVLRQIGLAERATVTIRPELGRAKIFIHYKSVDPKFDKKEYLGRLHRYID